MNEKAEKKKTREFNPENGRTSQTEKVLGHNTYTTAVDLASDLFS